MIDTVIYKITEENYYCGSELRISYGIVAYDYTNPDITTAVIESIHDITSDKAKIQKFVEVCNRLKLSSIHLRDVIDDFIN